MNQSLVENNARMFATITNEANMMLPLLTQSFKIRIKSGSDLSWSIPMYRKRNALRMGKWLDVKVNWEETGNFFVLRVQGNPTDLLLFTPEEFEQHVTQKGIAPKMFATWKLAAGK